MAVRLSRLRPPYSRLAATWATAAILTLASVAWSLHLKPRTWQPDEVPIAFWAWRNENPADEDVRRALQKTKAQTLFLRTGQIDFHDGTLRRIRSANGPLPSGPKVHLVYNATRALLAQLETVDENLLAVSLSETFAHDRARGLEAHATIAGLQVDIDVPTRLLPRYATTLRALRVRLPRGTELSITGLPTWMDSPSLGSVLDQVDFWIPQCYGSEIPERLDQSIPISSPQQVARSVARARELNRPFYAGLAAYSYALLYSSSGALITLRGDLNPARVAADSNLELVERRVFANTSEWRYVYRARSSGVIDGLALNAGDVLVIDSPSTQSLRLAARAVRENAGPKLLGVCVFRLPGETDAATLSLDQIAAALADVQPRAGVSAAMAVASADEQQDASARNEVHLIVVNDGTEGLVNGDGLTIDLSIPLGSAPQTSLNGFSSVTIRCSAAPSESSSPCSERRGNVLQFKAATLAPGEKAEASLTFTGALPSAFFARIEIHSDDGQTYVLNQQLSVSNGASK